MARVQSTEKVREDFDRIVGLSEGGGWDHNAHYHPFLLRRLPKRVDEVLRVRCGTGLRAPAGGNGRPVRA